MDDAHTGRWDDHRAPPACLEEAPLTAAASHAPGDAVVAAVVAALAGVRRGDRVAAAGAGPRTVAALLAMAGSEGLVETGARVVVAGAAHDVPLAVRRLAPGGRLVALAADAAAARRTADAHGLTLRHVEPLGARVAWAGVLPAGDG